MMTIDKTELNLLIESKIDELKKDLAKGEIALNALPKQNRVIRKITDNSIVYYHDTDKNSEDRLNIDILKETFLKFYGKQVTTDMLRSFNNAYSNCNAVMFMLLMNYFFSVTIYGNGSKGNPYYINLLFYYPPFSAFTNGTTLIEVLNHLCLWRLFMKNIMLRAGNRYLSVKNIKHVKLAVELAYLSMQPRTFKKQPGATVTDISPNDKDVLFNGLVEKLVKYFKSPLKTQIKFDEWHKEICEWFLRELNTILKASGRVAAEYGKAQKIINVAFKNLYLFDDAVLYEQHFKCCHFIISSENIAWYNKKVATKGAKINTAWSNMKYDEYFKMQENIREYLKSHEVYAVPFYYEFYVWAEYAF